MNSQRLYNEAALATAWRLMDHALDKYMAALNENRPERVELIEAQAVKAAKHCLDLIAQRDRLSLAS